MGTLRAFVVRSNLRRDTASAVLVAFLLAACGRPPSTEAVVRSSAERTLAAKTARLTQRITISPGTVQTRGSRTLTGEGTVELDTGRADLTFAIDGQTLRAVLIGGTLYQEVRPPASVGNGRSWLELDPDSEDALDGGDGLLGLLKAQSNHAVQDLGHLRSVVRVTTLGEERVRGARTTRYRATVDLTRAAESSSAERRGVRGLASRLGLTSIPVEVWLDDQQRVRRLAQTLDLSDAPRSQDLAAGPLPRRVEVSLELFDFGLPVTITIPPAEDVADADDLVRDQGLVDGGGSGTASPATDALKARLLTSLPSAYRQQPESVADTGPSDFEKAVRDEDSPEGRQLLTSTGFVAGYQRLWADGEGGAVIDFVYQFRSEAGARDYFRRAVGRATEEMAASSVVPFTVPGVPDATGLRRSEPDGQVAVVFVARGPYVAQIVVQGPDSASPELAVRLAQEQHRLLG